MGHRGKGTVEDTLYFNFPIAYVHQLAKRFWGIDSTCEGSSTADLHNVWLLTGYMKYFSPPYLEYELLKFN